MNFSALFHCDVEENFEGKNRQLLVSGIQNDSMISNDSKIFKPFVFVDTGRTRGCQGQASSASTMLASQVDVLSRFMVRFMFVVGICWDLWMLDLGPSWAPWTTDRNSSNLPESRWCVDGPRFPTSR